MCTPSLVNAAAAATAAAAPARLPSDSTFLIPILENISQDIEHLREMVTVLRRQMYDVMVEVRALRGAQHAAAEALAVPAPPSAFPPRQAGEVV